MEGEGEAKNLPLELWQLIFSGLGDGDLKSVSLCCKDFWTNSNPWKESLKVVHPNISMLSRHLSRFGRLKRIDLLDFEGNIVEAIGEIERSDISSSIEALDIPIDKMFEELREILRLGGLAPNLKALNCNFKIPCNEGTLEVITTTYPNLEQLKFCLCSDWAIKYLASKLKLLNKVHLHSCYVSNESLIALSLNCVMLKDVAISGPHNVTEMGIGHLLRNRPNLEALSVNSKISYTIGGEESSSINIENSISHAKALTSLVLSGIINTSKVVKAIAKAKLGLNNLGLLFCEHLTRYGLLVALSNHPLTKLTLLGAHHIADEDLKEAVLKGNVANLTHFEINECNGCKVNSSTLFLLLTRCPSLVDIRMAWKASHLHEQIPLSEKSKITRLHLDLCWKTNNDEFFQQFGHLFPNLKVLYLRKYHFKDGRIGIETILKSCNQITELNLSHVHHKPKMFEGHDPVELNLEVLTLPNSRIGDEGLATIAKKCPRLLSLDLSDCPRITTEGLKQVVENIKTLTSLNLMNWDVGKNYGALLEWMLSTSNLASLHKIFLRSWNFTEEQKDQFLQRGCLLLEKK